MNRSRLVTSVAICVVLIMSCTDDRSSPLPLAPLTPKTITAAPGADAPPTPQGIGGSYTITAGGDYVKAIELAATGIQVPEGVPVRVVISGAISVTPTPGLLAFCQLEFFVPLCTGKWVDLIQLRSIPPSGAGISWWPGTGNILASWNGGSPDKPAAAGNTILSGPTPADAELWAGREQFGCWYDDDVYHTGSGACFNYGGGFTVTVQADDGSDPAGGGGGGEGPKLHVSVDPGSVPTNGGMVAATALVRDGSTIADERWYFIPDSVTTVPGDTVTVPQPPSAAAPAASAAFAAPAPMQSNVLSSAFSSTPAPSGGAAQPAAPMIMELVGTAAIGSIAGCDESYECSVAVPRAGTVLVAATVDGVALSASQHVDAGSTGATLKLECTGAVTRGETATCTASVDPAGASFTVTGWSFTPSGAGLPEIVRLNNVSSTTWSGHMATSGTVHVSATVARTTQETSATIEVAARSLASLAVPFTIARDDPGELPVHPKNEHELGSTSFLAKFDVNNTFEYIADGPNTGFVYFTQVPVNVEITVSVNTAALSFGTDFWRLQDPPSSGFRIGTGPCTRDDVTRAIPQVEAHEGTSRTSPNSHVKEYMDLFEPDARAYVEPLVALGLPVGVAAQLDEIARNAYDVSGPRVDKSLANPFHLNCTFKYF